MIFTCQPLYVHVPYFIPCLKKGQFSYSWMGIFSPQNFTFLASKPSKQQLVLHGSSTFYQLSSVPTAYNGQRLVKIFMKTYYYSLVIYTVIQKIAKKTLFVCSGGFLSAPTQYISRSAIDTFETVNQIENNRHMRHMVARMQTVGMNLIYLFIFK